MPADNHPMDFEFTVAAGYREVGEFARLQSLCHYGKMPMVKDVGHPGCSEDSNVAECDCARRAAC
jgi:hypothetical protein